MAAVFFLQTPPLKNLLAFLFTLIYRLSSVPKHGRVSVFAERREEGHVDENRRALALHESRVPLLDSRGNFRRSRREESSLRVRQRDEETIRPSRVPIPRFSPLSRVRAGPAAIAGGLVHARAFCH